MAEFARSLPSGLSEELGRLAQSKGPNWWKEVLDHPELHLAVRDGYLNAYAMGQSVFKIALDRASSPLLTTHYKYLLRMNVPRGQQYVRFDGRKFSARPDLLIHTEYVAEDTVDQIVQAAVAHSNPEKRGVHAIAQDTSNAVIDVEIAFSDRASAGPPDPDAPVQMRASSTAPRMDIAALRPGGPDTAYVTFYEAKRADDPRIAGDVPEVVTQLRKYDAFLRRSESALKLAYQQVCESLVMLRSGGSAVRLAPIIADVARGRRSLKIDNTAKLVVFGYEGAKKEKLTKLRQLLSAYGLSDRLIQKGTAKGLRLS